MSRQFHWRSATVLVLIVYALGCGDDGGKVVFLSCGNGIVDADEECDDGNVDNNDACLNTCVAATCGDEFVQTGVEQCDGTNLALQTCATLGFASGTLRCTATCQFDTSACSGTGATPGPATATPEATPTPGTEPTGATPTSGGPTPIATATPGTGGTTCQQGDTITIKVAIQYDDVSFPDVSGVTTTLAHPEELDVPGNQNTTDQSRATNLTGKSGFFNVSDQDQSNNGIDDQIVIGLIATPAVVPPGDLATVAFDCAAGAQVPTTASFPCTADLSTNSGTTVTGASCSVTAVTGP